MRTTSITRDGGDDESLFTPHRLRFANTLCIPVHEYLSELCMLLYFHLRRSSRPVKKISQDNDSQSSGEEDDDDGFEILTAENLFSTLLQRVS